MFIVKKHTPANTHTIPVLNCFCVKPHGSNLCFIMLLQYVVQRSSLMTKILKSKLSCPGTGYPNNVSKFLIKMLQCKYKADGSGTQYMTDDVNIPNVWIRIPHLGSQGENLLSSCLKKICHCLKQPIEFIVIYNTKKVSYFISNKDKIPDLSQNNVIYQITCPGCSKSYIGKTNHCLQKHLSEHVTQHNTSAVAQHFLQCENTHFIADLCKQYNFNFSINFNQLLFMEGLHIKYHKPQLNSGLKASKELSLFI